MKRKRDKKIALAVVVGVLLMFMVVAGLPVVTPNFKTTESTEATTGDERRPTIFDDMIFGYSEDKDFLSFRDRLPAVAEGIHAEPITYQVMDHPFTKSAPNNTAALNDSLGQGGSPYAPAIGIRKNFPGISHSGPPGTSPGGNDSHGGHPGQIGDLHTGPDRPRGSGKSASVPEPAPVVITLIGLVGVGLGQLRKLHSGKKIRS